ncbi:MAG: PAS domain S-box protein [Planctomycetes bacterium]|nr:PAS domain S-box protein [Planctomycetota bacterium]
MPLPQEALSLSTQEAAKLRLIDDITERINLGTSLEALVEFVSTRLHEFLPYNRIAIALTDERREKLTIVAARSDGKVVLDVGYSGAITGSSLEALVGGGRTRIINDLQEYLAAKPTSESTRLIVKEGMRSSLTLPLLVQGNPIGVMFFSSRHAGVYRSEHEEFLRGIVGHVAIAVERTRLLDALREKTEYLENILHNSADAIVVVDALNRIRTWSEGARRMFGFEPAEVIGADVEVLVPPEHRHSGDETRFRTRVQREGFVKDHECVRQTKDGRRLTVQITSTLLRDKKGRILGRSSIVRDVTHLKKLQEDLIRSQSLAAVGELAATVAHEIKNPLAGISGAIQVIAESIPPENGRREIVDEILEQIRRLDNTVRDLLIFARPATPVKAPVPFKETFWRAWSLLGQQPAAQHVNFTVDGPDDLIMDADAHLLHQVWVNLFQNAVEAMHKGGTLSVRIAAGPVARVEIQDTGAGVSPEHMARLFRPFFSTKTRGTGLGLAITRKIIEAHGGSVWIESRLHQGTTVVVEIPR